MANTWPTAAVLLLLPAALIARAENSPLVPSETSAGPGATTLLVYDGPARSYSLMDLRGVVAQLLTRIDTKIRIRPATEVVPADLLAADYIVWLGTGAQPVKSGFGEIPPAKPLLVCGLPPHEAAKWPGAGAFAKFPPAAESWDAATIQLGPATLASPVSCVFPATGNAGDARVLARIKAGGRDWPLAWRAQSILWLPCLPMEDATGAAFSSVLPEFFGTDAGKSGVLLSIDDFHPGCDPATLRRAADYLSSKGRPFAVTVRMPPPDADAAQTRDFVMALAYAQARRGRIFLLPTDGKTWDVDRDRPAAAAEMDAAAASVRKDFAMCIANGILPVGVRLPDSGVSMGAAGKFAQFLGLAIGNVLPSDATATATFTPATITRADGRMLLLPTGSNLQEDAGPGAEYGKNLLLVGGAILSARVPAWLPFDRMAPLLERAATLGDNFLDPADTAAWVSTADGMLWTASAPAPTAAFTGKALVRFYDNNAQFLSQNETGAGVSVSAIRPPEAKFVVVTPCAP